jgi:hypothetical protein
VTPAVTHIIRARPAKMKFVHLKARIYKLRQRISETTQRRIKKQYINPTSAKRTPQKTELQTSSILGVSFGVDQYTSKLNRLQGETGRTPARLRPGDSAGSVAALDRSKKGLSEPR